MALSESQSKSGSFTASPSLALASNVVAGDLLIVGFFCNTTTAPVAANTGTCVLSTGWTLWGSGTSGTSTHKHGMSIYWAVVGTGGTCTVTTTLAGTNTLISIAAWAGANASPIDSALTQISVLTATASVPNTASSATTVADEVLITPLGALAGVNTVAPGSAGGGNTPVFDTDWAITGASCNQESAWALVPGSGSGTVFANWPTSVTDYGWAYIGVKPSISAAFLPRSTKPILQAVNRSNTY